MAEKATAPAIPPVPAVKDLPNSVKSIHIKDDFATVTYKDGKKETYRLNLAGEKAAFEEKFGEITPVPAPPTVTPQVARPATVAPVPALRKLPPSVKSININDGSATVTFNDGKKETYRFNIPDEKAEYEEKYGEIPPPPPAVLPAPPTPGTPATPQIRKRTNGSEQLPPGEYTIGNAELEKYISAARARGEIFVGINNRLDVKIDYVRREDIYIEWTGGKIMVVEGVFYAQPAKTGTSKLLIFKKQADGTRTLIKTVPLDSKRLPDPTQLPKGAEAKPVTYSPELWPAGSVWKPSKDKC
jgi:hypothetical protein